jgi:hypothetical protein
MPYEFISVFLVAFMRHFVIPLYEYVIYVILFAST